MNGLPDDYYHEDQFRGHCNKLMDSLRQEYKEELDKVGSSEITPERAGDIFRVAWEKFDNEMTPFLFYRAITVPKNVMRHLNIDDQELSDSRYAALYKSKQWWDAVEEISINSIPPPGSLIDLIAQPLQLFSNVEKIQYVDYVKTIVVQRYLVGVGSLQDMYMKGAVIDPFPELIDWIKVNAKYWSRYSETKSSNTVYSYGHYIENESGRRLFNWTAKLVQLAKVLVAIKYEDGSEFVSASSGELARLAEVRILYHGDKIKANSLETSIKRVFDGYESPSAIPDGAVVVIKQILLNSNKS